METFRSFSEIEDKIIQTAKSNLKRVAENTQTSLYQKSYSLLETPHRKFYNSILSGQVTFWVHLFDQFISNRNLVIKSLSSKLLNSLSTSLSFQYGLYPPTPRKEIEWHLILSSLEDFLAKIRELESYEDTIKIGSFLTFANLYFIRADDLHIKRVYPTTLYKRITLLALWLLNVDKPSNIQIKVNLKGEETLLMKADMAEKLSKKVATFNSTLEKRIPTIFANRFQTYRCAITEKPIRFLTLLNLGNKTLYFEIARIRKLFISHMKPPCWPEDVPFEERFLNYFPPEQKSIEQEVTRVVEEVKRIRISVFTL